MQPDVLIMLAGIAAVAGFLDALAGGGGLIVIPALLLAQVPPIQAIATNKLQGSFGTLTAAAIMLFKKLVSIEAVRKPFLMALAGAVLGAIAIQFIPPVVVDIIIPAVLFLIAIYFLFSRNTARADTIANVKQSTYNNLVVPGIGFYDGAFGPGAGSFYTLSGVALAGKNLVSATAAAKVLNFASNLASLVIFIISGKVLWLVGGVMVLGTMLGAYLGSLVIIHHGTKVIRPVIVIMATAMLTLHLWGNF